MRCVHCTESIPTNVDISITEDGQQKYFCCQACRAVYQTIREHQLNDFYQQREYGIKPLIDTDEELWIGQKDGADWVKINDKGQATTRFYIEGMHCTACAWLIEHYLQRIEGVHSARVYYQHSYLDLVWQPEALSFGDLIQHIANVGYRAWPYQADIIRERQLQENTALLKRIGISAILMMQIGMFSIGLYAGDYLGISDHYQQLLRVFSMLFSIPLLYYCALPFYVSAFYSLKARQPDMNISISLAITGLYSSSIYSVVTKTGDIYFDSAAMFCLFVLTARYIEKKSRTEMQPSQPMLPTLVTKIDGQQQTRCSIDNIVIGDVLLIREGDIIPLDGIVASGNSTVSEAFLSGESAPISKQPGDTVFAGSQNHDGQLQLRVTALAEQTLLHGISQLSQQAAEEKPRFISITDAIAAYFTVIILTLSTLTALAWLSIDSSRAFWVALSVVVVSCPCALSLAAPTALSSVHFRLRKLGVYIRSIRVLETINRVTHVVFDKTGTLSEGLFRILHSQILSDKTEQQCLDIAAALEKNSKHPLATAFFQASIDSADNLQIHPGAGVSGEVDGVWYCLGSPRFCQQYHPQQPAPDNRLWIGLCSEDVFLAWFCLQDQIRQDAKPLVDKLKQRQLHLQIVSGDGSVAVEQTAEALAISDHYSACSSAEKLSHMRELQQQGHTVLMLGDGINDAPVLAQSDVSATLFSASNWVKNSADMVLLNDSLLDVDAVMQAAKQYRRTLIQNFAWAFSYNVIAIPFAMAGFVTPWMAAIGMSLSSVIVVLNSRRLAKTKLNASAKSAMEKIHYLDAN